MAKLDLTGKQFAHYRILRLLGRGGMADVYLAEDNRLHRQVALKVLPPEFARDEERARRFAKEIRSTAELNHPHITKIYHFGEYDGLHYFTMSLLTGGDLKQRLAHGVSEQNAVRILKEVASALGFAHSKGFIHRDVKPENILFHEDGRSCLTDLGVALVTGSGTRMTATGMSVGTPRYMSPEQCQGKQELDGRSDLYSLGIVFYEMLTGKVPFDANNTLGLLLQHIKEPVPGLPARYSRYQPVVDRLLAKNRNNRYFSAEQLIKATEAAQSRSRAPAPGAPCKEANRTVAIRALPRALGTRWLSALDDFLNKRQWLSQSLVGVLGGAVLAVVVTIGVWLSTRSSDHAPGDDIMQTQANDRAQQGGAADSRHMRDPNGSAPGGTLEYALTIQTEPADATIKFLGNQFTYQPGMMLRPGSYQVELSRHGFAKRVHLIQIKNRNVEQTLVLEHEEPGHAAGEIFVDCPTCPEMVVIPAGSFLMGSPSSEAGRDNDEGPQHRIRIDHPFALSRFEITFEKYDGYAGLTGLGLPDDSSRGRGLKPVIGISWDDAKAYAEWLSQVTGKRYRLPSEAEWEYAARAGSTTAYWWGDNIGDNHASCDGCGSRWDNIQAAPIGSFEPNAFGLYDMLGNVWEWTEDCWNDSYSGAPYSGVAWVRGNCTERVLRGGSWGNSPQFLRSANRFRETLSNRGYLNGIRLARDL